jgi:uncharacterized protein (TIGR02391 family)
LKARDATLLARLATAAQRRGEPKPPEAEAHPFDARNVYPGFPAKVRKLFDDGYYSDATFTACKYLDTFVGKHATGTKAGEARMMAAFNESSPLIQLNPLSTETEKDEQRGYKFLFAGTMIAIRNPRGHDPDPTDDPDTCLDHLGMISALLRRLRRAGFH